MELSNVRTRSEIVKGSAGVKHIGQNASTAIQCWKFNRQNATGCCGAGGYEVKYPNTEMQVKCSVCTKSHIQKCIHYDT